MIYDSYLIDGAKAAFFSLFGRIVLFIMLIYLSSIITFSAYHKDIVVEIRGPLYVMSIGNIASGYGLIFGIGILGSFLTYLFAESIYMRLGALLIGIILTVIDICYVISFLDGRYRSMYL